MEDFAKELKKIVNDEDFGFISQEQDEMMMRNSYLEEGLEKGRQETIQKLVSKGLSIEQTINMLDLTEEDMKRYF